MPRILLLQIVGVSSREWMVSAKVGLTPCSPLAISAKVETSSAKSSIQLPVGHRSQFGAIHYGAHNSEEC